MLVPRRLSFDVRAVCTLPMVPCSSSPVTRVLRSPLPCEKRSAWGGGWHGTVLFCMKFKLLSLWTKSYTMNTPMERLEKNFHMVPFANEKLALQNQKWDFSQINFSFHTLFKAVFKMLNIPKVLLDKELTDTTGLHNSLVTYRLLLSHDLLAFLGLAVLRVHFLRQLMSESNGFEETPSGKPCSCTVYRA